MSRPGIIVAVIVLCVLILDGVMLASDATSGLTNLSSAKVADLVVSELIEQLGAESYATRFRARQQLLRLGLEAFDEVHAAQYHPDIEIELAARYLVTSLMVSWSLDTDPPEVRETLQDYGSQSEIERSRRIERLALMDAEQSVDALIRLTRFETSPRLSEVAALALMNQTPPPMSTTARTLMARTLMDRTRMNEKITRGLGGADRPSAQWLRVYAKELMTGEYSQEAWDQLIAQQREQIDTAAAHPATRQSVLDLVRISASRAADSGDLPAAIELATRHMDLIEPTSGRLIDAATWAIDHDLHPVVLHLRDQFKQVFDTNPMLLYAAAEATKVAGHAADAQQLAMKALKTGAMPDQAEAAKMSASRRREIVLGHLNMARRLSERGQFQWSLREYHAILDSVEMDSFESASARWAASWMLGELQDHQGVVEMLEPLVNRIDKDEKLRLLLQRSRLNLPKIRSKLLYHQAESILSAGKMDEARKKMSLAYLKDTTNIDILIRMYHTPGDAAWQADVKRLLGLAIRNAEKSVQRFRGLPSARRAAAGAELSEALNNYAWLVSNTQGDYDQALQYSLESIKLSTDGAKYDTCARCYYAVGDLENAIITQKKAIRLMPHSPPMERQLAEFEKAIAEVGR